MIEKQQPVAYELPGTRDTSKVRGCLWVGCLTVIVFIVLVLTAIYFAVRGMVYTITEPAPKPLPTISTVDSEINLLQLRVNAFKAAVESGTVGTSLSLTETELNTLLGILPELAEAQKFVRFTIKGESLGGSISAPFPFFSDRYINGEGTFIVKYSKRDGLAVYLNSLKLANNEMSSEMIAKVSSQNLATEFADQATVKSWLAKVRSIEIKDGTLTIVAN